MFIDNEIAELQKKFYSLPRYTFIIKSSDNDPYIKKLRSINGNYIKIKEVEIIINDLLKIMVNKNKEIMRLKNKE